jgi:hypothetical protein
MRSPGRFFTASTVLVFLLIVIPLGTAEDTNVDRQTVKKIFAEANRYYEEGLQTEEASAQELLFEKALLRYKQLFEQGHIVNGRLFCNIGNIYAKLGERAKAVLFYKRGLYYGPREYRCKNNLYYLRNRLLETENSLEGERTSSHAFRPPIFTPKTAFTLFTIFFILATIGTALLLWGMLVRAGGSVPFFRLRSRRTTPLESGPDRTRDNLLRGIQTAVTYFVVSTGFAAVFFLAATCFIKFSPPQGVVMKEVTLREGDGVVFSPIKELPLPPGTEITVIGEGSGWYRIKTADRTEGWIPSESTELVPVRNPVRARE